MVSPLLAKAAPTGREIVNVTPERAGWTHVGFRAVRLAAGEVETVDTDARELCLVVLTGTVDVEVDGQTIVYSAAFVDPPERMDSQDWQVLRERAFRPQASA